MAACAEFAQITVDTETVEQTRDVARRLAGELSAGDFVALVGPLGAGKTAFVQGLAEVLGVDGAVTSPTFVLMRLHRGDTPLCHADAYRLSGAGELFDLGLEDWRDEAVVALEWADTVREALPRDRIDVLIEYTESGRRITIRGLGPKAAEIVERVKASDDTGR